MMNKVTLISTEAGSAHAVELAKAMDRYCNLTAVWHHHSAYGIDYIYPKAKIGFKHIPPSGDELIICGLAIWKYLPKLNYKKVKVIIPDGLFMRQQDYWNEKLKNYTVFTTNCKYQFAKFPVIEYYQPFDINLEVAKCDVMTVGHSVFGEMKMREKGSRDILGVLGRKDVQIKFIKGLQWDLNLLEKSRCHIFVDQIDHYVKKDFGWNGGIGKSGLEAMLLDCLVICHGEFKKRELPVPPIAWCTRDTFEEVLDYYITHKKEREVKIQAQKIWADKYLNPDYCARRVLQI